MISIHKGRLKTCWRDFQRINKVTLKQLEVEVGCPANTFNTLLLGPSNEVNTPFYQALIDFFGDYIRMDYHPPHFFRTYISNSNHFQVSEFDLIIKCRSTELPEKLQNFVAANSGLFVKYANYTQAIQNCEKVDKQYLAFISQKV